MWAFLHSGNVQILIKHKHTHTPMQVLTKGGNVCQEEKQACTVVETSETVGDGANVNCDFHIRMEKLGVYVPFRHMSTKSFWKYNTIGHRMQQVGHQQAWNESTIHIKHFTLHHQVDADSTSVTYQLTQNKKKQKKTLYYHTAHLPPALPHPAHRCKTVLSRNHFQQHTPGVKTHCN